MKIFYDNERIQKLWLQESSTQSYYGLNMNEEIKRLPATLKQNSRLQRTAQRNIMPEVSRFFGIVITIYAETPARHHESHFHAYYGEHSAVVAIGSGGFLAGSLPTAQRRLVEAWRHARRAELQENWDRLQARQRVNKIAPLE